MSPRSFRSVGLEDKMLCRCGSAAAAPQILVLRSAALDRSCAEMFAGRTRPAASLSRGLHSDLVKGAGHHLYSQSDCTTSKKRWHRESADKRGKKDETLKL